MVGVLVNIQGQKRNFVGNVRLIQNRIDIFDGDHCVDNLESPGLDRFRKNAARVLHVGRRTIYPDTFPSLLKQETRIALLSILDSDFHEERSRGKADAPKYFRQHAVLAVLTVHLGVMPNERERVCVPTVGSHHNCSENLSIYIDTLVLSFTDLCDILFDFRQRASVAGWREMLKSLLQTCEVHENQLHCGVDMASAGHSSRSFVGRLAVYPNSYPAVPECLAQDVMTSAIHFKGSPRWQPVFVTIAVDYRPRHQCQLAGRAVPKPIFPRHVPIAHGIVTMCVVVPRAFQPYGVPWQSLKTLLTVITRREQGGPRADREATACGQ